MHLDLFGRPHRIYVEEAGEGTPLLCLHTAGSDGRQYRGLMNDARVTAQHRVIAFDMPWHGKSSPPAGWHEEEYQLTSAQYTTMMLEVMQRARTRQADPDRLLDRRTHLPASGARASRTLSAPSSACRPAPMSIPITISTSCTGRTSMAARWRAPSSPAWSAPTRRTRSAGKRCGTTCRAVPASSKAISISTRSTATSAAASPRSTRKRCPLFLLSGEYDYSCTPEETLAVANSIRGCEATIMKGLGHFPMSEDPQAFLKHLLPVLEKIAARRA